MSAGRPDQLASPAAATAAPGPAATAAPGPAARAAAGAGRAGTGEAAGIPAPAGTAALAAIPGTARAGAAGITGAGRLAGFREALHAEWTKLRTMPSTAWLLAVAVVLTVAGGAVTTAVVKCSTACSADPVKNSLTGVMLGQAAIAVLAVMMLTGEYSSGMIRTTLAAMPRRTSMLAAKASVLTGIVIVTGVVAVLGSLLVGQHFAAENGFTTAHGFLPVTLAHGPVVRAAAGSVLYFGLVALLSLGIAVAVRESAVAITVVLGLLYVLPIIGGLMLSPHWERRFDRYSPMSAGLAIQATRDLGKLPIGPWPGLGVLACWAAAALLAGGALLRLRDA
jgi:ABC-2 type transport system permease protein